MQRRTPLLVVTAFSLFVHIVPMTYAVPIELGIEPNPSAKSGLPEQRLVLAYQALGRGDLTTAERTFKEAVELAPGSAGAYIGLAEVALHREQWSLVETQLRHAMETDPGNQAAVRALGRFQFLRGNFARAESLFKDALSLNPAEPRLHIDLGDTYLGGLNNPGEAESAYREAIKLQENHVIARLGLAASLAVQGKISQAIVEYNVAAKYETTNPLPLHLLGRLYASQGRFGESLAALDRALQIDPNYVPGLIERGDVYVASSKLSPALVDYQLAATLVPGEAPVQFRIGTVYQAQGRWKEAKKAYFSAIDLDPMFFNAYNNLAWMAGDRGVQLDEGLLWIKKAIEISPQSDNLYDTLGWVHRARGEKGLAIIAFTKAVAGTTPQPGALYRLGLTYAEVGKNEEAVAAFRRALDISKDFPEAAEVRRQLSMLK